MNAKLANILQINSTTQYKYLGGILDQALTMNQHFEQQYIFASIKSNLTKKVVTLIYNATILYYCTTNLKLTNTQLEKNKPPD